ncbi:MAG: anti-sigma factor antagonist [Schwartzia sp.]|nr:anti-sigma factor antagonist [Schwartzia sp. (in: firmicutes)]
MDINITKKLDGSTLTLSLAGRLDKLTGPIFDQEFRTAIEGVRETVLDFSALDYLSSAGLRSLIAANNQMKKQGGTLTVKNPTADVMDVFEMTTFGRLIHIVKEGDAASNPTEDSGYYPLRPVQRWLVDTHFQKAKSTMMNVGGLIRLDPSTDMERLAGALNDIMSTYDIFRCRLVFDPETGDICQRFDGEVARVVVESLSDEAFEKRKLDLKEPYTLIDHPLYRIYLMKTPSGQYLYMDFYHAVMDGTAIALIFWRELDKRYTRGKENAIARTVPNYAEYVLEESKLAPETLAEGHAYWRRMLDGFDEKKHLPPVDVTGVGAWTKNEFETPLENALAKDFFRHKEYSENTFFMAAAMLAMAKSAGVRESVINWVHNGRMTSSERRLLGLMLNQIPIRWDFEDGLSVGDFLRGLEARIAEGMKYTKSLDIVYNEGLEDNCATFILQKGAIGRRGILRLGGADAVIVEMPDNELSAAENTLDIELNAHADGTYSLVLNYDASRYSVDAMHRFAQTVDEMIGALTDENRSVTALLES